MLLIVPDQRDGLHEIEKRLSASVLRECLAKMSRRKVKLYLPKFRVAWSATKLTAWLSALGMPLAFSRSHADFSGIDGHEPPHPEGLFISNIFQKAFVDVNEEGTEAAAASAVVFRMRGRVSKPPPVPTVRADHPFLFAILDRYSDSILFFGRMSDPTKEN
jgi:serpin B